MASVSCIKNNMTGLDYELLEQKARRIRATAIQMSHDGREGHLNGALSCTDILVCLYNGWLNIDPNDPKHPDRDRFIFSKGHACASLYAVMADKGFFNKQQLCDYAKNDTPLPSHPCIHALPALECSSGSLGHGLGVGTGKSYALKLSGSKARVAVLIGDGESNEGSTWEAAMFAAANKLDNLLVIVDNNGVQSVGRHDELTGNALIEDKFHAFGWAVQTIDGHNMRQIMDGLQMFPFEEGRPSAIIAKTIAGAGVSFMEDQVLWHYRVPSDDDLNNALKELGESPIHLEKSL